MTKERRNPAGIIIAIIGAVVAFGGLYVLDSLDVNTPQLFDLAIALWIITIFAVCLVAFGGIVQIMLDE